MTRSKRLRRVCDSEPGIRRERRGDGFVYLDAQGEEISDPDTLARIRSLAIPPAYTDVWVCVHANGHIQATGRDARGRKQYRYHPEWRWQRDETKFGRMAAFGRTLPAIRAQVARDIRLPGLPRAKVLATIVRLLETTLIRVGNDGYAKANKSYGLTTLRNQHVAVHGTTIAFSFRGKHGIRHRISLRDRTLAGIVQRARALPGHEVFQYVDRQGQVRDVTSDDVNSYLRNCTDGNFTAKDFRTWAGTVLCFAALLEAGPAPSPTRAKRSVNEVVARVAERLGNTPAVCRKSYIHPVVIDAYVDGSLFDWQSRQSEATPAAQEGLNGDEAGLLAFLEERCL
ncbi:MAG TPA: DNA topoisomerase IB [Rhodocyclaceae bacterium]|nr:DNA topoisomerase IB [Rhodocyclaceae bacterium]